MSILVSSIPGAVLQDRAWVRKSFLMAGNETFSEDLALKALGLGMIKNEKTANLTGSYRSTVWRKYTSTRPGGNWTFNNIPQFTPFADPRFSNLDPEITTARNPASIGKGGMGEFYSESFDDNAVRVALQFGVPEYNGMVSFFTGFYDNDAAMLANDGVIQNIGYYIGRAAGLVVGIAMLPVILVGSAVSYFLGRPTSRYYYMRETMPLYWNRVNVIANTIAVNMGLVERAYADAFNAETKFLDPNHDVRDSDKENMAAYRKIFKQELGDIFLESGGINVYALSTKTQRMADKRYEMIMEILEKSGGDQKLAYVELSKLMDQSYVYETRTQDTDWDSFMKAYHEKAWAKTTGKQSAFEATGSTEISDLKQAEAPPGEEAAKAEEVALNQEKGMFAKWQPKADYDDTKTTKGWLDEESTDTVKNYWMAQRRDGGKFVYVRVDNPGSVSESFSNSFGRPQIVEKINGISQNAREMRFSVADGNTGIGLVDQAIGGLKAVAAGAMESFHMSGLMSLAGSAFVDIPDRWQDASMNAPSMSFTMELRSPYGHPLARFLNLYLPLTLLLAGTLPISTGKASYTSPFLCSAFLRGRGIIRTGMIDSLQITRGAGNFGFTRDGECLAIDVSFSIKDLSTVMHAPIDTGFSILKPWKGMLFDEENMFNDYMAVLGNLSQADMIYPLRKMMLNLTKKGVMMDTYFSKAHLASMLDESWVTRWVGTTVGAFVRAGGGPTQ